MITEKKCYDVPARISLSKDGEWFHDGVEITHERTIEALIASFKKIDDCYYVQIGYERCRVEIEDAPYIVKSVTAKDDAIFLTLNDHSEEIFDQASFEMRENGVPYTKVKQTRDLARFSRAAWNQLAQFIDEDGYFLLRKRK